MIELMVAVVLGLLVIGAVSGVFLSTSRNYTQDELLSRMQENARFALHVLGEDLSMAGYWGPLISGKDIETTVATCPDSSRNCEGLFEASELLPIATDCPPDPPPPTPWAYSIEAPIEVAEEVASEGDAADLFGCLTGSDFLGNTDILVVKRVEGEELASGRDEEDDDGDVFIRTDGSNAMLFHYSRDLDESEAAGITDWRYRTHIYFIKDNFIDADDEIPTLTRMELDGTNMTEADGGIAQGIEYFHIMFGIDTDNDSVANRYESEPTLGELEDVVSARIFVLARSVGEDFNYVNDKTYRLGDVTKDFSGDPDNFYRRVFTTTVTLRNQRNRITTTGN